MKSPEHGASKKIRADCHKVDQYKRRLRVIWVAPIDAATRGKTLDVGHAQIRASMAWWYRQYAEEQSLEDRAQHESAEYEAKVHRIGLWSDKTQVSPRKWRRKGKAADG